MRERRQILSLFLVASLLTLASVATTPPDATARPTARHEALEFHGTGVAAHRGASSVAPENTLASVREALETSSEFIEVDVRLTSDGVPVLMHDRTVDRTTNGSGALDALTLAAVKHLDAGSWFDDAFAGERVPTFTEFIDVVEDTGRKILIEMKGEWNAEEAELLTTLIEERGLVDRVAMLAFSSHTLRAVREANEDVARVWLVRKFDDETLRNVAELGVNGVGARLLIYERYPTMTRLLESIGVVSLSYTLNDPREWSRAHILGVDIIATDRASALGGWLNG